MILYVNSKGEVKDVNSTTNTTLTELPISENSDNPFANWPVARICCYRVGVIPEKITEVVTDADGNEVTETKETGKYIISMMTPYMDSRIVDYIARLGGDTEVVASDLTDTQMALIENYDQTVALSEDLTDTQMGLIENYDLSLNTASEVTDCQMALVEIYNLLTELLMGGM